MKEKKKTPNIEGTSDIPCSWKILKRVVKLIHLCVFCDYTIFLLSFTAYSFSMLHNHFALSDLGAEQPAFAVKYGFEMEFFILIFLL